MSCGGVEGLLGGVPLREDLPLVRDGDYVRTLALFFPPGPQSGQPQPYPPGQLALRIYTDPITVWPFTISGSFASIKVESEDVNKVPDRARVHLVWLPAGEVAGGIVWAVGNVRVTK